eukprot:220163-Hanusia_phi.AAC.1
MFVMVLASPWIFLHFLSARAPSVRTEAGVKRPPNKQVLLLEHSNASWAEKGLPSTERGSEGITRTVREALLSIKGLSIHAISVLTRGRRAGFHVNSDEQEREWNASKISFHVASKSCDALCKSHDKICGRDWFAFVDRSACRVLEGGMSLIAIHFRCDVAKKVFPDGKCSYAFYPDMPFYDKVTKEIFVSKDSKLDPPTCDAVPLGGESSVRLCPCVPASHERSAIEVNAEKNVLEIMKKIITELVNPFLVMLKCIYPAHFVCQNAQERLERSRGVTEGIELDVYGKQVPKGTIELVIVVYSFCSESRSSRASWGKPARRPANHTP